MPLADPGLPESSVAQSIVIYRANKYYQSPVSPSTYRFRMGEWYTMAYCCLPEFRPDVLMSDVTSPGIAE
jgi:hypothetical protein